MRGSVLAWALLWLAFALCMATAGLGAAALVAASPSALWAS